MSNLTHWYCTSAARRQTISKTNSWIQKDRDFHHSLEKGLSIITSKIVVVIHVMSFGTRQLATWLEMHIEAKCLFHTGSNLHQEITTEHTLALSYPNMCIVEVGNVYGNRNILFFTKYLMSFLYTFLTVILIIINVFYSF